MSERAVPKLKWCEFCRDLEPDTPCATKSCNKTFHLDCIHIAGGEAADGWKVKPGSGDYYCPDCVYELTPKAERKKDRELKSTVQVRLKGIKQKKIGNVQICYVCQHGGRLLGCAKCPQSYHPKCVDQEILKDVTEEWACPLCRGIDPLRHIKHKRMTDEERAELSAKRQKNINKLSRELRQNRNVFLWAQRESIKPFVFPNTLAKLKKSAATARSRGIKSNKKMYEDIDPGVFDQLEQSLESQPELGMNLLLNEGINLKSYQTYGVAWLLNAFEHKAGAILADEMGLGKTIQTLAFLSCLKAKGIDGPHLVVVPLSTVGNWVREIQRFVSHLSCVKICGSRAEREHAMQEPSTQEGCVDIYITTYETVATEEGFFADHFHWTTMILDEAHRIKADKSAVKHSLDRLTTAFRVLLTGTPLQNNVKELHTLLNFLFPDILTDSENFERAFQTGGGAPALTGANKKNLDAKKLKAEADVQVEIDEKRLNAVVKLLKLLMLRRTKDEVVELPPKIMHDVWVPLNQLQLVMYRGLLDCSESDLTEGKIRKMLGTMIKMRLLSSHPSASIAGKASQAGQTVLQKLLLAHSYASSPEAHEQFAMEVAAVAALEGEDHIQASTKLMFLDKLLSRLHGQNMNCSQAYRDDYTRNVWNTHAQGPLGVPVPPPKRVEMVPDADESIPSVEEDDEDLQIPVVEGPVAIPFAEEDGDLFHDAARPFNIKSNPLPKEERPLRPHMILIFSQFRLVLNELEKYCRYRGFKSLRLDGSTNKMIRELDIREFNDEDSTQLVYLIGTRAGGMGINLVTANHVVLFDEDWNPFVDMQAIDRAHRIGQTREVHVWKITSEWTVEERMAFRRAQKMQLDEKLIRAKTENAEQEVNDVMGSHEKIGVDDVKRMLVYGAEAIRWLASEGPPDLCEESLGVMMRRERAHMPENLEELVETARAEEEKARLSEEEEGNAVEVLTEIQDGNDDDDEEHQVPTVSASNLVEGVEGSQSEEKSKSEEEEEDEVLDANGIALPGRRRGTRIRKPTQAMYVPDLGRMSKQKVPIRHDSQCFICQDKEFKQTVTVTTDAPVAEGAEGAEGGTKTIEQVQDAPDDEAAFLKCNTCPKVYHVGNCLGLPATDKDRKNFKCQWHECSICYRKSSQAGGMLIHCAACPTSFCFDCFPPEYRRYSPNPMYYESLRSRGFKCSPENFITYVCSRCKAMEQQKRRSLLDTEALKRELATEKAEQARLKDEEKYLKELVRAEREDKAKRKAEDKVKRKVARELKDSERKNIQKERLRRLDENSRHSEMARDLNLAIDALYPDQCVTLFNTMLSLMTWTTGSGALPKSQETRLRSELNHGVADEAKGCTNCYMPLHKSVDCPWPPEFRRISHYLPFERCGIDDRGIPYIPDSVPGAELFADMDLKLRPNDMVIEIDCPTAPEVPHTMEGIEVYKKKMTRGYCSGCGLTVKDHTRRNCPILTLEEVDNYDQHKHDLGTMILNIKLYAEQFRSRLPPMPDISSIFEGERPSMDDVDFKKHPWTVLVCKKAVEVANWRNVLLEMVNDFICLITNAINLQHINHSNPEFTKFMDPVVECLAPITKVGPGRGRKRPREEPDTSQMGSEPARKLAGGVGSGLASGEVVEVGSDD